MTTPFFERRYAYVIGMLIVLAAIAVSLDAIQSPDGAEDVVVVSSDGASRTYTTTRYSFSFSYPANFYLMAPGFSEAYMFDDSLSDRARERRFQRDLNAWRAVLARINRGVVEGEGAAQRKIDVSVMDPDDFPTVEENAADCETEKRMNPHLGEDACGLMPPTSDLFAAERALIEQTKEGQTVTGLQVLVDPSLHSGLIVASDSGVRGIRTFHMGKDVGDYIPSFITYGKNGERITVMIALTQDAYPEVISRDDQTWRQTALQDPRNAALDQIISSFTFLE